MTDQVTGILTSANPKESGKSLDCVIDGQKFNCLDFGIQSQVGNEITFEAIDKDYQGHAYKQIKYWSPTGNSPAKSNGASPVSAGKTDLPLPFISNTVATAISAGLIKKPEDIESWVVGCHRAVTYLNEKDISGAVKEVTDSLTSQKEDDPF